MRLQGRACSCFSPKRRVTLITLPFRFRIFCVGFSIAKDVRSSSSGKKSAPRWCSDVAKSAKCSGCGRGVSGVSGVSGVRGVSGVGSSSKCRAFIPSSRKEPTRSQVQVSLATKPHQRVPLVPLVPLAHVTAT